MAIVQRDGKKENGRSRKAAAATGGRAEVDMLKSLGPSSGLVASDDTVDEEKEEERKIKSDSLSIVVLIFLYVLQGIPLGLAGSVPMILQGNKASYDAQAFFSFVNWPFSLKLLWAPVVDSVYIPAFGRRKSWLVPIQYLIGVTMMLLSASVDGLIGDGSHAIRIVPLTAAFFGLCFLAATQDIAVDGWALTMLSRKHVGWASTCNSVGQTAGYFLGNVLFLALESKDFCNRYLRSTPEPHGIVTLPTFLFFWGLVFIVATTLVALLKHEQREVGQHPDGVLATYRQLVRIARLPAVARLCVILLTCKIGFAATDAVAGLKMIDAGMPKEKLALLGVPMVPLQIVLPILISKYSSGAQPFSLFIKAIPLRLLMGIEFAWLVWVTPSFKSSAGDDGSAAFPVSFYLLLLGSYALHQVALYCMFVALMSFHAKISDPAVGGTYMTLLNTLTNLGGNWPATLALFAVGHVSWKRCDADGGSCSTVDGFYVETAVCTAIGIVWLIVMRRRVERLQTLPADVWKASLKA